MNKFTSFLFSGALALFLVVTPSLSFAVGIATLNALGAKNQFFATTTASATTMHMKIVSATDTHTFQWDASPWLLAQGGTGATSFTDGSIPFIWGGVFVQSNGQLFWNNTDSILSIGGTATVAKVNIKGSGSLDLLDVATSAGSPSLYVKASGNVGIGNSSPLHALDVSGAMYSRLVTLTDAPSLAIDWNAGNVQSLTLSTNTTLTFSDGQVGGEYKLILKQDATGGRTITWPVSVKWVGGIAPTLTSNANGIDVVSFVHDGSFYLGSYTLDHKVPVAPPAGIAFDNAITQQTSQGTNNLTFSYTTSGTNRYLFVGCVANGSGAAITNITYAGTPMTQINSLTAVGFLNETDYLFGLAAPATGIHDMVVTTNTPSTIACAASSYTGAQQTTAVEASNTAQGQSGGTAIVSVTTITDNDWLVGFARMDGAPTAGPNTVNRGNSLFVDMMDTNGAQTPAGSHSMNYTGATDWNWIAAALKPAGI